MELLRDNRADLLVRWLSKGQFVKRSPNPVLIFPFNPQCGLEGHIASDCFYQKVSASFSAFLTFRGKIWKHKRCSVVVRRIVMVTITIPLEAGDEIVAVLQGCRFKKSRMC